MNSLKTFLLSSFSSSSSSDNDEEEDEEIALLVALHQVNTTKMLEILKTKATQPKKYGGSVVSRKHVFCKRKKGHDRLFANYFIEDLVYPHSMFWRRFRMTREIFMRILNAIKIHHPYFVQKIDATKVLGLFPLQKMTSAIRMLAYGMVAEAVDDYVRIGESTVIDSLKHFCQSVIEIFEDEYCNTPTRECRVIKHVLRGYEK